MQGKQIKYRCRSCGKVGLLEFDWRAKRKSIADVTREEFFKMRIGGCGGCGCDICVHDIMIGRVNGKDEQP